jgi:DNA-binding response OmpR family regulator
MPADGASPQSESRARILSTSADPRLGALRADVLRSAGYEVVFPKDHADTLHAIATHPFDVLILGHSISTQSAKDYAEAFRARNADGKVLVVYQSALVAVRADAAIRSIEGPEALIAIIESLCGRDRREEGKSA